MSRTELTNNFPDYTRTLDIIVLFDAIERTDSSDEIVIFAGDTIDLLRESLVDQLRKNSSNSGFRSPASTNVSLVKGSESLTVTVLFHGYLVFDGKIRAI